MALASGEATAAELREMSRGWQRWAASDEGSFAILHGEVLART